eukprot:6193709-Pleurochrysis_carterae.AAC.5
MPRLSRRVAGTRDGLTPLSRTACRQVTQVMSEPRPHQELAFTPPSLSCGRDGRAEEEQRTSS